MLQGSASELESDLPFAVFVNALDEFVHGLPAPSVESLGPQMLAELAGLLPSLCSYADNAAVGLQHERYRSHRAVRDLLELLAARQPVVLVLDDLHWVDWASAELVTALLGRPPSAGVLIGLGRRSHQTVPRLASALDRAHRSGHLVRLEPAPLTVPEARLLLGGEVPDDVAEALCAECGGNPFYLEELARSTRRDAGAAAPRTGDARTADVLVAGITVPAAVAASMDEELRLLAAGSRRLLESAAVAGDPFELALATTAADLDDSTAVEALDDLLRLDVVRTTDVPTRFRFRHPIVRRAVYEAVGAARRLVAHERCARALTLRSAPATTLAGHVERCGRRGDLDAVAVLREAGDQASLRAPASAARWYGAAAEMLPAAAPAHQRGHREGALLEPQDRRDAHPEHLRQARRVVQSPDRARGLPLRGPGAHLRLRIRAAGRTSGWDLRVSIDVSGCGARQGRHVSACDPAAKESAVAHLSDTLERSPRDLSGRVCRRVAPGRSSLVIERDDPPPRPQRRRHVAVDDERPSRTRDRGGDG